MAFREHMPWFIYQEGMSLSVSRPLLVLCPRWPFAGDDVEGMFVKEQVEALARKGRPVVVAVLMPWPRWVAMKRRHRKTGGPFLAVPDGVKVFTVPYPGAPVVGLRGWSAYWGAAAVALRMGRSGRPALLHGHFTVPCGAVAARLARQWGCPSVLTVHENQQWLEKESRSAYCRRIWGRVTVPVRVNHADLPMLRKSNPQAISLPNGFSMNRLPPMSHAEARRRLGLEAGVPVLFCLGALTPRKGQRHLVDALAILARRAAPGDVPPLLVLGGDGPDRGGLESHVRALGLEDRVRFLGRVPDDQVGLWYHAADATLLASGSEGNPTVLFESLGCGTPFIGTDVGGVSEVIVDDRLGRVIPDADPRRLAEAVQAVLAGPIDRAWIREHSQRYTWDALADRLLALYGRLAGTGPHQAASPARP